MSETRTETVVERYERLAAEFHRETGMLAPGKDDALGLHRYDQRSEAWHAWLKQRPAPLDEPPAASRAARPADGREAVPEDVRASLLAVAEYAEAHRGPYEELYDDAATLRAIAAGTHPAVALVDRARLAQLEADAARDAFEVAADALRAEARKAELGEGFTAGPLAGASVYNVFVHCARWLTSAARSARAAEGDHA